MQIEIAQGFTVELGDDGYQLTGPGGEESGVTEYGDAAEVEVDGKIYETTVESREEAMEYSPTLYLALDEVPEVEEVDFDVEDGEDRGGGDE